MPSIHNRASISGGQKTLRGKQTATRVAIDSILIHSNKTAASVRGKARVGLAKSLDANVHGNKADVSSALGVRDNAQ